MFLYCWRYVILLSFPETARDLTSRIRHYLQRRLMCQHEPGTSPQIHSVSASKDTRNEFDPMPLADNGRELVFRSWRAISISYSSLSKKKRPENYDM